jgi:hypothetical protein
MGKKQDEFDSFELKDSTASLLDDVDSSSSVDVDDTSGDVDKKEKKIEIPGHTIKLSREYANKLSITFLRKPNGEMQKNLPMNPGDWKWGHVDQIASAMTDVPLSIIRMLEGDDLAAVRAVVMPFLMSGLAIGESVKE